jgi:hypothetical protein
MEKDIPDYIWNWMWEEISEVSDEIGTDIIGSYLLAYEGWSILCVEPAYNENKTGEENEEAYFDYAEDQAETVLREWKGVYRKRYSLVTRGHERMNVYGVTWALFKLKRGCAHKVPQQR